jgi:glutaredoxin
MSEDFKARAYLKNSCPFCFKLVMFMSEAGLMDQMEIICIDGENEAELDKYRELLQQQTGEKTSFPTVEIAPGEFNSDSDGLIEFFASKHGIDANNLPGLAYYKANLMPAYRARFMELKQLREKLAQGS